MRSGCCILTTRTDVATPKTDPHPKKLMSSVWWGVNGMVAKKLKGKQDRIYSLHDNARPHVAKSTREKLLKLGWITVPHPPYSPDLAPTDYHLFRSLSNHLREKKFDDENDIKRELINFFNKKSKGFYERGTLSLPER